MHLLLKSPWATRWQVNDGMYVKFIKLLEANLANAVNQSKVVNFAFLLT